MNWQRYNKYKFRLEIEDDQAHLWLIPFKKIEEGESYFRQIMSQDELSRAGRFHFEKDRTRYVCGRGFLRLLLGRYLSILPSSILFEYNDFGKPELSKHQNLQLLTFNTSHAEDYLAFAVTNIAQIGIDIEILQKKTDLMGIAERFFSAKEFEKIKSFHNKNFTEAFYNCWTRKEAFIKAVGDGLSIPLNSFEVSIDTNEGYTNINFYNKNGSEKWRLLSFKPATNYVGALAVNKNIKEIKSFTVESYYDIISQ